jgi:hypothetical protein
MNTTATQSVQLTAKSPAEVAPAAAACSLANPGKYVTVTVDFDYVLARLAASLNVFAPTDSWGEHYWLNGKAKPFTDAQRAADWQASPTMS